MLGIVGTYKEVPDKNVLLLTLKTPNAPGLKSPSMNYPASRKVVPGEFYGADTPISYLAHPLLEFYFKMPVIDKTGLTNRYDFILKWNEPNPKQHNFDGLKQALTDQLGLELVSTNMPIKMLVVERVK